MTKFDVGQEVEIDFYIDYEAGKKVFRKGKIVKLCLPSCSGVNWYEVQFHNGKWGIFDDGHIRSAGGAHVL